MPKNKLSQICNKSLEDSKAEDGIRDEDLSRGLGDVYKRQNLNIINADIQNRTESYSSGSDLLTEANIFIRVYITDITDVIPGDKLAGRHGNKGVISCILPKEDMPFTLRFNTFSALLSSRLLLQI